MKESEHKKHGIILGIATAGILSVLTKSTEPLLAIGIGAALGTASTIYMERYGHGLPSTVQLESARKPYNIPNPRNDRRVRASPGSISSIM
jgi:hypothetical protein